MKKTKLILSYIEYLGDGYNPYIEVNWAMLGIMHGFIVHDDNSPIANAKVSTAITLNISPRACFDFEVDDDRLVFSCSIDGRYVNCNIPVVAIKAIYEPTRATGMFFDIAEDYQDFLNKSLPKKATHLRVVK